MTEQKINLVELLLKIQNKIDSALGTTGENDDHVSINDVAYDSPFRPIPPLIGMPAPLPVVTRARANPEDLNLHEKFYVMLKKAFGQWGNRPLGVMDPSFSQLVYQSYSNRFTFVTPQYLLDHKAKVRDFFHTLEENIQDNDEFLGNTEDIVIPIPKHLVDVDLSVEDNCSMVLKFKVPAGYYGVKIEDVGMIFLQFLTPINFQFTVDEDTETHLKTDINTNCLGNIDDTAGMRTWCTGHGYYNNPVFQFFMTEFSEDMINDEVSDAGSHLHYIESSLSKGTAHKSIIISSIHENKMEVNIRGDVMQYLNTVQNPFVTFYRIP